MIPSLGQIPAIRNFARLFGKAPMQPSARQFLLDLIPADSVGAEIGVHKGDFSAELLAHVRPRELHLIDPWQHETSNIYRDAWYGGKASAGQLEMDERYQQTCDRFEEEMDDGRVIVHRGYSDEVLAGFSDDYFDWVYIDGNHLYEFVRQDLLLSLQKVRPGGMITGDDYTEGGWWEGGVKLAVDEFVREAPVELMALENRQFALRVKG
ncbi:MAG: class I SAM-dependent methyltransferase [Spongiibacteraceae bacterium]|jgi:hypothetical protein|nr:class I SAM-dependent methyltransferase [Spongiibacteraceae bacterium]